MPIASRGLFGDIIRKNNEQEKKIRKLSSDTNSTNDTKSGKRNTHKSKYQTTAKEIVKTQSLNFNFTFNPYSKNPTDTGIKAIQDVYKEKDRNANISLFNIIPKISDFHRKANIEHFNGPNRPKLTAKTAEEALKRAKVDRAQNKNKRRRII